MLLDSPYAADRTCWRVCSRHDWIYAYGFFAGAAAHGYDTLRGGFLPYTNAPFALNVYWTSLLALDLTVVFLIAFRPRWTALLAVVVMISDMLVETDAVGVVWRESILTNFRLYSILAFGVFVLVTAPRMWRRAPSRQDNT